MAISGDSFCASAWNGFLLNLKYCAKFYFALNISGMFIFMGILSITAANTGFAYLMMMYFTSTAADIADSNGSILVPIIFIAILSLIIASIFLGLFDEAVLATIHCYAVDSDLHDGEPKFGPKSYHDKLNKLNDVYP